MCIVILFPRGKLLPLPKREPPALCGEGPGFT